MSVRRLAEIQPASFRLHATKTRLGPTDADRQISGRTPSLGGDFAALARAGAARLLGAEARDRGSRDGCSACPIFACSKSRLSTRCSTWPRWANIFVQMCGTTPVCARRALNAIKEVLPQAASASSGHVTARRQCSPGSKSSAWAPVAMRPMVQINDDYYEDLTPENFNLLLDNLAAGKPVAYRVADRPPKTSEPAGGLTSLFSTSTASDGASAAPDSGPHQFFGCKTSTSIRASTSITPYDERTMLEPAPSRTCTGASRLAQEAGHSIGTARSRPKTPGRGAHASEARSGQRPRGEVRCSRTRTASSPISMGIGDWGLRGARASAAGGTIPRG